MNQEEEHKRTLEMAGAWTVETQDLTSRVASAIGAETPSDLSLILAEVRAMRNEVRELKTANYGLQEELFRLRLEISRRPNPRLDPYTPSDSLLRLS